MKRFLLRISAITLALLFVLGSVTNYVSARTACIVLVYGGYGSEGLYDDPYVDDASFENLAYKQMNSFRTGDNSSLYWSISFSQEANEAGKRMIDTIYSFIKMIRRYNIPQSGGELPLKIKTLIAAHSISAVGALNYNLDQVDTVDQVILYDPPTHFPFLRDFPISEISALFSNNASEIRKARKKLYSNYSLVWQGNSGQANIPQKHKLSDKLTLVDMTGGYDWLPNKQDDERDHNDFSLLDITSWLNENCKD